MQKEEESIFLSEGTLESREVVGLLFSSSQVTSPPNSFSRQGSADLRYSHNPNLGLQSHWKDFKKIFFRALPIATDNTINFLSIFGGAKILSMIGNDEVVANAYIESIKNLLVLPSRAIFYSLQNFFGTAYMQKNNQEIIGYLWRNSLVLATAISLLISIPLIAIKPILTAMNYNRELIDLIGKYFKYYTGGIPAILFLEITNQLFVSTDNQYLLIPISMLKTIFELGMGFLFVNNLDMGIEGWGFATLLQPLISSVLVLTFLKWSKNFTAFQLFRMLHFNTFWLEIKSSIQTQWVILKKGLPAGLQLMVILGVLLLNVTLLGHVDIDAMVSYNISGTWCNWFINLYYAVATAVSVQISQNLAENNIKNANQVAFVGIVTGVIISLIPLVFSLFLYNPLTTLLLPKETDISNEAIIRYSQTFMPLAALTTLFFSVKYIFTGALRGYGETTNAMISEFVGTLGGAGLGALLCLKTSVGVFGIGLGDTIGALLASCIVLVFFCKKIKNYSPSLLGSTAFFSNIQNLDAQEIEILPPSVNLVRSEMQAS